MNAQKSSASETVALADEAKAKSLVPLWAVYKNIMSTEPAPACAAAHWSYEEVRPLLMRAAREISTEEAERRVLLLRNPGLDKPFATHTLGCGLQVLLEGEVEGAHRHTPAALRLVIEGDGAYTTTDGERMWMKPGDVITTPSWTWHDHGKINEGEMIWLDGIDVPLVNFLHLNFTEYGEEGQQQALTVCDGDSHWRYGSGLMPLSGGRNRPYSPIYHYPYARSREVLGQLSRDGGWDACHGLKLRLTNPRTGGNFMPTIAGFMQLLPAGFSSAPVRSTDAQIFSVVEGSGRVHVADRSFAFNAHDVFVVPNWTDMRLDIGSETVLFSYSDRAMQENLSLWRERRGDS